MDWEAKCLELQSRIEELEAENRLLRSKLGMVETAVISTAIQEESLLQVHTAAVHMRSSTDEKIQLFRSLFRVPWGWTYTAGTVADWIAQFSFGFHSLMLTSTIIGLIVNILFKPRTWCSFCPMGTMTQMICKIKAKEKL